MRKAPTAAAARPPLRIDMADKADALSKGSQGESRCGVRKDRSFKTINQKFKVPSKRAKRQAAKLFRMSDPDADDSSTASESECERLERYPKMASPRARAKGLQNRLKAAAPKAEDDGGVALPQEESRPELDAIIVRIRRDVGDAAEARKKIQAEKAKWERWARKHYDNEITMGGVVVDGQDSWPPSKILMKPKAKAYTNYQLRRSADAVDDTGGRALPLEHLGQFGMLPAELRNQIYRLALLTPSLAEPYEVEVKLGTCALGLCTHAKLETGVPGLLNTCQQVRAEALPIFCGENTFKFTAKCVRERCAANWLRALGEHAARIPSVSIIIEVWDLVAVQTVAGPGAPPVTTWVDVHNDYEITVKWVAVPENSTAKFLLPWELPVKKGIAWTIDNHIQQKDPQACEKVVRHMLALDKQVQKGEIGKDEALVQILWSDLLADLVWKCGR